MTNFNKIVLFGGLTLSLALGASMADAQNGIDHAQMPAHSFEFGRWMQEGAKGEDVVMLQEILQYHGLFPQEPTAYFGPATADAVSELQRMYHLEPVGYVGPQTINLLNRIHDRSMGVDAVNNVEQNHQSHLMSLIERARNALLAAASGAARSNKPLSVTFRASATTITEGTGVRLSWKSNANSCTASGAWDGIVDATASRTILPAITDTYTIVCTRGTESVSKSITITIIQPSTTEPVPTLTFSVDKSTIAPGESVTLTWSAMNATSCTASEGWSGTQSISGTKTFTNVTASQAYMLMCAGAGGTTTKSVNIAVQAPTTTTSAPTATLVSTGYSIRSGESITLTWSTTDATSCTAIGSWSGSVATAGIRTFTNLTDSQAYGIVCTGPGGTVTKVVSIFITTETGSGPISGLDAIPSNFDINSELAQTAIPPLEIGDVGAFRFICNPSHLAYDDPIVYPGQPGKAHLHQFFGNTGANAYSTYESLRSTGNSTCNSILNRSSYWIPAMMNGKGQVVRPDYVSIYYKRVPTSSPRCDWTKDPQGAAKQCVDIPRGLRFVFDRVTSDGQTAGYFNCDGPTATPGHYTDIVEAAKNCPMGNRLGGFISSPTCWDGKNLDSPDHRSHMAYPSYGSWGYLRCPDTHPYLIPQFSLGAWYTVDEDLDRSGTWDGSKPTWHLSSDAVTSPMRRPGTTFHADWFGAWDDTILNIWHDHCIDKQLSCSAGNLGNGQIMKMFSGFSWTADPRVVDPPRLP